MTDDNFDFSDLSANEKTVKIRDNNGEIREYILREAFGDAAKKYRSCIANGLIMSEDENGVKTVKQGSVGDLVPLMVSACLFYKNDKGKLLNVTQEKIQEWPDRIVAPMYAWIIKTSGLEDKEETLEQLIDQRDKLNKRIDKLQKEQKARNQKKEEGEDDDGSNPTGNPG